jgi:hypothetical protein
MKTIFGHCIGRELQPISVALLGLLLTGHARSAQLHVYAQLPSLEDAALSPDGSRLAYVRTDGDERIVAIVSMPAREPLGAIKVGAQKPRAIQWADNNRLLITTSMVYSALLLNKVTCDGGQGMKSSAPALDGAGTAAGGGRVRRSTDGRSRPDSLHQPQAAGDTRLVTVAGLRLERSHRNADS